MDVKVNGVTGATIKGVTLSGISVNRAGVVTANVVIEKLTSNDPDNGRGNSDTANDIMIAANCRSV